LVEADAGTETLHDSSDPSIGETRRPDPTVSVDGA
jgi:hypothetical protein